MWLRSCKAIWPALVSHWISLPLTAATHIAELQSTEKGLTDFRVGARPDVDPFLTQFFHSSALPPGFNWVMYDTIDELIEEGRFATSGAGRASAYVLVQQRFMEDLPVIPLYHPKVIDAIGPRVTNWARPVFADFPLHLADVAVD